MSLAAVASRSQGEPLTTAGGGSFVRGEVNRNERAPQCGVATIEVAERAVLRMRYPLQGCACTFSCPSASRSQTRVVSRNDIPATGLRVQNFPLFFRCIPLDAEIAPYYHCPCDEGEPVGRSSLVQRAAGRCKAVRRSFRITLRSCNPNPLAGSRNAGCAR